MKNMVFFIGLTCLLGCNDHVDRAQSDAHRRNISNTTAIAIFDGKEIGESEIRSYVAYKMNIFETIRRINYPMQKVDLKKVRYQKLQKYQRTANNEVLFKELVAAVARRNNIQASDDSKRRIREQYEMMLARRPNSYLMVTSVVDQVGFLPEFEKYINDEAVALTCVRSINTSVNLDISEKDIDDYIGQIEEKDRRVSQFNAEAYQTATNVLKRLKAGEDFEKLAKQFSFADDKDEGGDMGEIILTGPSSYCNYAPAYVKALMMNDGAISDVIQTPMGVEIFQVVKHTETENQDDPIIKRLRHICFRLQTGSEPYTRDSVGRRIMSNRLKELYGPPTIAKMLDMVKVDILGVEDSRSYFLPKSKKVEE